MKKTCVVSIVFILLLSLSVLGSEVSNDALLTEPDYNVATYECNEVGTNISDNIIILNDEEWGGTTPKISDNGCVVWAGRKHSTSDPFEIFYWNGTTTTRLTNNAYWDYWPEINANGVAVWHGQDGDNREIYIYDGTNLTQLTNDSYSDNNPKINDLGQIVWRGDDGFDTEIYFWDGFNTTQITDNDYGDGWPEINNLGQIAWQASPDGLNPDIFFWDGTNVTQITNNSDYKGHHKINNNGEVVWGSYDGSNSSTSEIFFWNGSEIFQITNNSYYDNDHPDINDNGEIVWYSLINDELEINLWNGTGIIQITESVDDSGYAPHINNKGHVTWPNMTLVGDLKYIEVCFWDGNNIFKITNDTRRDDLPVINNEDQLAWMSRDTSGATSTNICYIDLNGLIEPDIDPIDLSVGWNLISLPFEQYNESIDQVLISIDGKWDCIRAFDALNDTWLSVVTSRPDSLNDLRTLNHKMGLWINIIESNLTLTVGGSIPSSASINLYAGWNLIGYPSLTETTVADALWGTGADRVEAFDPAEPYRIREVGPTYLMKPGEGYWVHVPADTTWIINW